METVANQGNREYSKYFLPLVSFGPLAVVIIAGALIAMFAPEWFGF